MKFCETDGYFLCGHSIRRRPCVSKRARNNRAFIEIITDNSLLYYIINQGNYFERSVKGTAQHCDGGGGE